MQNLFINVLMLFNCQSLIRINREDTHCEVDLEHRKPILHRFTGEKHVFQLSKY